jgi:hypothetical protein
MPKKRNVKHNDDENLTDLTREPEMIRLIVILGSWGYILI